MEQYEAKEKLNKITKELFELWCESRDLFNLDIQNMFGELYSKSKDLKEYLNYRQGFEMNLTTIDKQKLLKWIKKNRFQMDTTHGRCWEWAIIEKDLKKFVEES